MSTDIEQITLSAAVCVSVLAFLPVLWQFVELFPSLCESLFRTSVCIRIEDSKKVQRSRNLVFLMCLPAAFTIIWKTRLYSPDLLSGLNPPLRLAAVALALTGYLVFRTLLIKTIPHHKFSTKILEAAAYSPRNFWIILTIVLFLLSITLGFAQVDKNVQRIIIYCISGVLYLVFIVRRFQIFASGCNFLTAILYLCALEILPTILLVVPAVVF